MPGERILSISNLYLYRNSTFQCGTLAVRSQILLSVPLNTFKTCQARSSTEDDHLRQGHKLGFSYFKFRCTNNGWFVYVLGDEWDRKGKFYIKVPNHRIDWSWFGNFLASNNLWTSVVLCSLQNWKLFENSEWRQSQYKSNDIALNILRNLNGEQYICIISLRFICLGGNSTIREGNVDRFNLFCSISDRFVHHPLGSWREARPRIDAGTPSTTLKGAESSWKHDKYDQRRKCYLVQIKKSKKDVWRVIGASSNGRRVRRCLQKQGNFAWFGGKGELWNLRSVLH